MNSVQIKLPASLHRWLHETAEAEGVTPDQMIALALAEKMASLKTIAYLEERGRRGSREAYDKVLSKAPDVEPEPYDRL